MSAREDAEATYDATRRSLEQGREPERLADAVTAQLVVADRQLSRGNAAGAARFFARAAGLAFHRALHFDAPMSPLARDAAAFGRPFRDSAVGQALRAPRGRAGSPASVSSGPGRDGHGGPTVGDGPTRVTLLTRGNANFLDEIEALLAAHPRAGVRHVDVLADTELSAGLFNTRYLAEQVLTAGASPADREPIVARAERALRPVLDASDTLVVDWCGALAALVNLVDPRGVRVVVRLHSYEAFTHWPHLVDWSRVDDLVFVSDHLRDLAVDAIPGLREQHAPRLRVLPLNRDLQPYARPKTSADARFELALLGWGSVAKDPLWALEVLRELRRHDRRYRLRLVGSELDTGVSPAAAEYGARLGRELAPLEAEGAVRRTGQTDDVPAALTDVGVVLSSSVRESFHAAVVEGAASAALPVVRDWPFFAHRRSGARSLYPADWVVTTPQQAAERIRRLTVDEAGWRAAGEQAQRLAMATWDWRVTRAGYEELLLP